VGWRHLALAKTLPATANPPKTAFCTVIESPFPSQEGREIQQPMLFLIVKSKPPKPPVIARPLPKTLWWGAKQWFGKGRGNLKRMDSNNNEGSKKY